MSDSNNRPSSEQMAKIAEAFDSIVVPEQVDWNNPSHLPWMLCDIVEPMGLIMSDLDEDELNRLYIVALDVMPNGQAKMRKAVEDAVYALAVERGYDWVYLGTNEVRE